MATQNLGNVRALIVSSTAPSNTNLIWRDTSTVPFTTRLYNTQNSTWEAIAMATGGESNTASNLGTGEGIFAQKVGVDLRFKSLVAGSNTVLTPNTETIMITSSGEANTASNLGTGEGIFTTKSGVNLPFKSLAQGSNITLSSTGEVITINANTGAAMAQRSIVTTVPTQGATLTIDMAVAVVRCLDVANNTTSFNLDFSNASLTVERRNKLRIDNSSNTQDLTVTFITSTILQYVYAMNEFPGTFPTMNVDAGSVWNLEVENESDDRVYIDFAEVTISP